MGTEIGIALSRTVFVDGFGSGKLERSLTPAPDSMSLIDGFAVLNALRSLIFEDSEAKVDGLGSGVEARNESRNELL